MHPPICDISYECYSVEGKDEDVSCDNALTTRFDPVTGILEYKALNKEAYRPGFYKWTIRGRSGTQNQIIADATFTLTLNDPCLKIDILGKGSKAMFADFEYTIGDPAITLDTKINSLVKLSMPELNCGFFTLEFVQKNGQPLD